MAEKLSLSDQRLLRAVWRPGKSPFLRYELTRLVNGPFNGFMVRKHIGDEEVLVFPSPGRDPGMPVAARYVFIPPYFYWAGVSYDGYESES